MTRGLTARLLLVGGLALLLCAGTFAVVLSLVRDVRSASRSLQASNERTADANRVLALVVDLETGLRGYVVAGDQRFLEPFNRATAQLPGAQRDLLDATAGDPGQTATARDLVDASNAYLGFQAAQRTRADSDREGAIKLISSGAGKLQVDRVRRLVQELTVREARAAAGERDHLDDGTSRAVTLAIVGLIATPLLVALLVLAGARQVARPLRRMATAARRLQDGELDVRVDESAHAEVGELARSFNAMAASLGRQHVEAENHSAELEAQGQELAGAVAGLELEKERMETIHAVVAALAAESELDRLSPLVLELLRTAAKADAGALYLEGELHEVAGLERARLKHTPEGLLARAIKERRPVSANHGESGLSLSTLGEHVRIRHELHLPLVHSGRAVGAVSLATIRHNGPEDLEALWLMADAAAVALSNALALEAARQQAEANRAVLETAHDAYVAVDEDLEIVTWTPQAEAMFGYSEAEALGRRADELLIPERWRPGYRAEHRELLVSGAATRRFEIPAVDKEGRRLTVEFSVSSLKIGQRWQANAFVRDIGERVARERAREAQGAVSQALAETGAGEDVVPHILEALARTLGWPVAIHWLPGPQPGAIWHEDAQAIADRALAEALRGAPEGRFLVPLSDTLGMLEFRQRSPEPLEAELMQALEDISKFVAAVLERRRAEREADRLKNEFFALVSHELRTPLTSILGYVEILIEDEPDDDRFLRVIERNARRLQRVVGDLLFVAQVEAGTLSLDHREVDLEAVVADAIEAGRPRAEAAGIELTGETDALPPLQGDPDRIAQVVDNLVANAVKFTPPGGRVQVRATRRDGSAVIEVSDTGIGIPPDEQEHLFERFYRTASATERSIPGLGLGLSIVHAICAGHGGAVAVRSAEGQGTTFTVELPIPIGEVTQR